MAKAPLPVLLLAALVLHLWDAEGPARFLLGGVALYSRIVSREDALLHPHRRQAIDLVRRQPGLYLSALSRALGLSRSTTDHHVRILERARLLVRRAGASHVALYPPESPAAALPPDVARCAVRRALYAALAQRPEGLSRPGLHAAALHVPRRTRNHAIRSLVDLGLVVARPGPGGGTYALRHASGRTEERPVTPNTSGGHRQGHEPHG
ncbi:MAG TPA: helix-turn-helix domain-containing protein [Candidatus Thermoplasmatota archaeon]|nr:helix-turn-helix domain-containing protein [Candidatus Thermoplasmatota archaeon]